MPVAETVIDSDLPCHGCCAFPAAVLREVGGEREDMTRGLDPVLRQKIRDHGYRVVLAPGAVAYHEVPANFTELLRVFHRNGKGSAETRVFHPDLAYDTEDDMEIREPGGSRKSFPYRIGRFGLRLPRALLTGRLIRFAAYCAYAVGYLSTFIALRLRRESKPLG
jgi:cellulose synthase/poly-beta-1,6-N-acetylglucosamine synthase-like glycosyltransferase